VKAEPVMPLFMNDAPPPPTSAKQLDVVEIDMRWACDLNRKWHSLLPDSDLGNMLCGNMSVAYAAEYGGMFYAVAIWSQPIIAAMCDGRTIELRRLAICSEAPRYTASRMMAVMRRLVPKKYPFISKAISYLAIDRHEGTIYRANGWNPIGKVCSARPQRFSGEHGRATAPLQTDSRKQRWEVAI
jgi:hypothetical protein